VHPTHKTSLKTRILGLPFGENRIIKGLFLLKLYHNLTDRWREEQTVKTIPITTFILYKQLKQSPFTTTPKIH